jgi:catechol 1,2-dioxygenase
MASNERVAEVATDLIRVIENCLVTHGVTHQEYRAAWAWLQQLAESGEVPLCLDVFFESTVERSTFDGLPGSAGTVEGPYYVPDAPVLAEQPCVLPMREDEPGQVMVFAGRVTDLDGRPLPGATVDLWQAGNDGTYSNFVGTAPEMNLRGRLTANESGEVLVRTIRPAPYRIPHHGPTGQLLEMLGRHPWRPAHLHFKVSAPGCQDLVTQLYFAGGEWLDGDGDVVGAVKDDLVVKVHDHISPEVQAAFGLPEDTQFTEYDFALRPSS